MKVREIFAAFRQEIDDTQVPYLWGDPILYTYLNEAEREAARRARLLKDSSTAEIVTIAVTAPTALITLDTRIVRVRRVRHSARTLPLTKIELADLERWIPEWETETGEVTHWCPDFATGKIRLFRIPEANGTLTLSVIRLPLVDMTKETDSPEIPLQSHMGLVHWMLHRAYNRRDTETYNPKSSAAALEAFEMEFGAKSRVIDEQWDHEHHGYDDLEGQF